MTFAHVTWTLCARRSATIDPDGSVIITQRFTTKAGTAVEQAVVIRASTLRDRAWMLVFAEVCPTTQLASTHAVAHAASLGVGGLCTLDGSYFLQQALPVGIPVDDLDATIDLIAHEAARLRTAAPPPAPVFAELAD